MIDALLWAAVITLLVGGIAGAVIGGTAVAQLVRHWRGVKSDPVLPPDPPTESKPRLSTQHHGERYAVYLVAQLDPSFDPPRVCHLSTYTSGADSLTRAGGNDCKVNLVVGYGDSYDEARQQVEYQITTYPWLKWAQTWLTEDRGHLGGSNRLCPECGSILAKDPLVQEARKALALGQSGEGER